MHDRNEWRRGENQCRGEKLWVPDDNESQRRNDFVNEHFPSTARLELFQLRREDGGDVLTPAAFDKFLAVHNRLINASYTNDGVYADLPDTVTFTTLCLNQNSSEGAGQCCCIAPSFATICSWIVLLRVPPSTFLFGYKVF